MRQPFLTIYDYGTGGMWQYITADSPDQITAKYPRLKVFVVPPDWWSADDEEGIRRYDVEAEPDQVLKCFTEPNE